MRYFVRVNNENKPVRLFRFNLDIPNSISEERWDDNKWEISDQIVEALVEGSMDYDEIDEKMAKKLYPNAFEEMTK